jgi:hypothetical protein
MSLHLGKPKTARGARAVARSLLLGGLFVHLRCTFDLRSTPRPSLPPSIYPHLLTAF